MPEMPLDYAHDGCRMIGRLALPDGGGRRPAVLVMHEGRGIGGNGLDRMRRLAARGYVALASDMYGEGRRFAPLDAAEPLNALLGDPARLLARAAAAVAALKARPEVDPDRVAAIGFCFGGKCVLELARSGADLRLFVSFHGLLGTHRPAAPGAIRGRVAAFCGDSDPYAPLPDVAAWQAEMQAAGADWQLALYGNTAHAFTDPGAAGLHEVPGVAYSPLADRLSWEATVTLLEMCLGAPDQAAAASFS